MKRQIYEHKRQSRVQNVMDMADISVSKIGILGYIFGSASNFVAVYPFWTLTAFALLVMFTLIFSSLL